MSVRTVAVHRDLFARRRVVAAVRVRRSVRPRAGYWARLADDRDLIGIKLILIAGVLVLMMALEVPW